MFLEITFSCHYFCPRNLLFCITRIWINSPDKLETNKICLGFSFVPGLFPSTIQETAKNAGRGHENILESLFALIWVYSNKNLKC